MTTRYPAVTLHRPWTACITDLPATVAKRVENRTWTTPRRGPVWLHAGKQWDDSARTLAREITGRSVISADPGAYPAGFVALAELVDVCDASFESWTLRCGCGPWAMARQMHWRFAVDLLAVLPEPLPCRGSQGLWWPPPGVQAQLAEVGL